MGIYATLFLILYIIEACVPAIKGTLLQWSDPAFVVGIPASVIGVAYVLTIRNPQNYTGFYGGIVMALLLAWQFALMKQWGLTIMYTAVFVPFMIYSIICWRKQTLQSKENEKALCPTWLSFKVQGLNLLFLIGIVAIDSGLLMHYESTIHSGQLMLKLTSGVMIGSSILANFWLIYQKLDAWIWWVVYSIAGMTLYALIGNAFSFVLFSIFLIVNTGAGVAWIKLRKQNIK
jgi:nicotinamide riboside transporter PnuC